jgi:plastocyanin
MKRLVVALVLSLALAASALAAVRATTLNVKAVDGIKFDKKALRARAGVVKIVMKSVSPLPHNVAVKGKGVNKKGKIVPKGGVSTVVASLKPGRYVFYCSVPGHEAAGMKGTLRVA